MNFPDYNNFLQLQKHLSRRLNLRPAVMVGAGMSLNSTPLPGAHSKFPTWRELSRAMFDEVYPLPTDATRKQKEIRESTFNRSNALRIASEFEAQFDRRQLDYFLLKSIPNSEHQPGNAHKLLLNLPWKDVFTTNYDTLLERTYVPGRSYQPVLTINDLAISESPRIIKLHGSISSHTQLIITEEDYRTYPQEYAPFVNTVRQSLIENAFVLIGFSGDDPNFLEWIGWIRDELGKRHTPIYLVGLLALTNVDRALLAQRRVTPIDLSPIFEATANTGAIHSIALEWFLLSLQTMEPPRPERWPEPAIGAQATTIIGMPELANPEVEPETVESLVRSPSEFDEITAINIIVRWRHERMKYPGWLIPTNEMRSSLWRKTQPYIPRLIHLAQNWSHVDQILLYREMIWRVETSILPLDTSMMEPFCIAADGLFSLIIDGSRLSPSDTMAGLLSVSDTEVSESWLETAFALLRDARESYDAARWNTLKDKISQVVHSHPQHNDRYYYEQALWLLWDLERNKVRNLLTQWLPSPHSPLAMMRKAGVLVELDDLSEARSLLREALQEIRQSFHRTQGINIDLLSLEGWCTYLLLPIETDIDFRNLNQDSQYLEFNTRRDELREQFLKRWDELKAWDSDPWSHLEYFNRVLSGEPPATQRIKHIVPGFDVGHYSVKYSLSAGSNTKWLPAFSYLRLHEMVGIPLNPSNDTLRNAADWLAPISDFWSTMLLVRSGNTRAVQEGDSTNRTQIASMNSELAHRLNTWAMNALSRESSSLGISIPMQSRQLSLIETLIEFLSRLTLRLEKSDLQDGFRLALRLHNLPGIKTHIRLNKSCRPWFRRLFDAVDDQQLLTWLPYLIRFSLPEEANENEPMQHPVISWPDPMTDFPVDSVQDTHEVDPNLKAAIHEAIEWLLYNTQVSSGVTRQKAFERLFLVFHTNKMTEEQKKHFGDLLWEHTTENNLPDLPNLALFNCLHLPSPHEVKVKSRLKQQLLTLKPQESVSLSGSSINIVSSGKHEDQMIHEVSIASKPVIRLPSDPQGKIEWELSEVNQLWNDVNNWWENDKHAIKHVNNNPSHTNGFEDFARRSIERIGMFLSRVVLPQMEAANEEEWNTILSFLSETRQDKVFLTQALPYILLHRPSNCDMVLCTIRNDLASNDEKAVIAAAEAVSHWAYLGDETDVERVPQDAINDLIKRVVFRRPEGAKTCLRQLSIIISKKSDLIDSDQVHLVVSSLTPWLEATLIPIPENDRGGFPEHERPLLRTRLGQLASAISDWMRIILPGQPEPPEISTLRELYSSDPLPEVRRSFSNN